LILAGDIGGTNTRLAWFDTERDMRTVKVYASRNFSSLAAIVDDFINEESHSVDRAAFGVAGPVRDGRSKVSNLDWEVDAGRLASVLRIDRLVLANDLEVNAYGIASLASEDFAILNEGTVQPDGNEALIAAGTGLGEAGLHWEGNYHRPFASEGGHTDFAPRDETEWELFLFLNRVLGHVSYERVLSGPGLFNIYRFLRDTKRKDEPSWLSQEIRELDPPTVISRHGLSGESALCVRALDMFVRIYGAEAGNLTLKLMGTGGLFVGGGIAPKILPELSKGRFMEAFVDKGRMKPILECVPVSVIKNDKCALFGAARLAALGDGAC